MDFNHMKLYNDMNTDFRKKRKKWFWKIVFLSWWTIAVFQKMWENTDIKLVTTEEKIF